MRKFIAKDTKKYGKGMYATRDIQKGEVIHLFKGKRLDVVDVVSQINSGNEFIDDPLQVGKRTYLNLDETSRTFNHSCDPNAALRKRGELFAIKNIKKGDQITYDYSSTIAPTEWKMKCKCESDNCRKTLSDVTSIPKSQMDYYKKVGGFQRYMKLLLKGIAETGKYVVPKYEIEALEKLGKNKYDLEDRNK